MYTIHTSCTLDPGWGDVEPVGGDITGAGDTYTVHTLCTLDPGLGDVQLVGGDIRGAGDMYTVHTYIVYFRPGLGRCTACWWGYHRSWPPLSRSWPHNVSNKMFSSQGISRTLLYNLQTV